MSAAQGTDVIGSLAGAVVRFALAGALRRFAVVLPGEGQVASVVQRAALVKGA